MIQIAVMGYGTVGSGVVEVLTKNKESIARKAGNEIAVKHILDLRAFPDSPFAPLFTKDFADIINDDEISVVVECMGGLKPAYDFVKQSLLAGKSVVTSNKELVAAKGAELLKISKDNNVNFFFEASVGGGIPIIRPLYQCLAANEVYEIAGILNGTTNFILTKMIREKMSFQDALDIAQALGYAESDPSADVQGDDACRKICILASLAFGKHIYPEQVHTEGITKVTLEDVAYAQNFGGVIKLLGRVKKMEDGKLSILVSPAIVTMEGQLSGVEDVFNAILVRGDAIGDVVFYGRGAGKMPTASAVVADVIDSAGQPDFRKSLFWEEGSAGMVANYRDAQTRLYIRARAENAETAFKEAGAIFGDISRLFRKNCPSDEIAFITGTETEAALQNKIDQFIQSGAEILGFIRITDY